MGPLLTMRGVQKRFGPTVALRGVDRADEAPLAEHERVARADRPQRLGRQPRGVDGIRNRHETSPGSRPVR